MEWAQYTFAEAIYRVTRLVLRKDRLGAAGKADHLHELLCLMVKRLPKDWGTETRKVLEVTDCSVDDLLIALDDDLQHTGFEPGQYAVFGALRQVILTIRALRREAKAEPSHQIVIPTPGLGGSDYASAASHA